jgi:hypothetical protein
MMTSKEFHELISRPARHEEDFEFEIEDLDGTWGHIRSKGKDEEEAKKKARDWLLKTEVEPNGSLDKHFTLRSFTYRAPMWGDYGVI